MRSSLRIPGILFAFVIALSSASALADEARTAWQVADERPIEVEGRPLALSPDGAWIAGTGPNDDFCVWDVATLAPTCDGELPIPVIDRSVAWSPDSTAVAFSLDAPRLMMDSDVYVFETATGTLHNLTEDDPAGTGTDKLEISADRPAVPVDLFPAWSPDSQELVFARTMLTGEFDTSGTTLMTISRSGGEPEELFAIVPPEPLVVYSPMIWQEDGSILFTISRVSRQNGQNGIWRLDPDGQPSLILRGTDDADIPGPLLADVTRDGTEASVMSLTNLTRFFLQPGKIFFLIAVEEGGHLPWETVLEIPIDPAATPASDHTGSLIAPPVFSPDGNAVAFLTRTDDDAVHLSVMDGSGIARDIWTAPALEGATTYRSIEPMLAWATNGTLLVLSPAGATLLTVEYHPENLPGWVPCSCTPPPGVEGTTPGQS